MSNIIQYKNVNTSKILQIDLNRGFLNFDSKNYNIGIQNTQFSLFKIFFESEHNIIEYSKVCKTIGTDDYDKVAANKKIYQLRETLKKVGMDEQFIETVNMQGYKISDKWVLLTQESLSVNDDNFLDMIRAIIDDNIKYCNSSALHHDQSGLSYIMPDESVVLNNFNKINEIYKLFMSEYSRPGNSIEILHTRNLLGKLLTYFIYWRVGDGLTDEKWKSDYKHELELLFKQISQSIDLISD